MKMSLHLLLLLFVLSFFSCKEKIVKEENVEISESLKNKDGEWKYDFVKNDFSDFIVFYDSDPNIPLYIKYVNKGVVKNNTENIYKKAIMKCVLLFQLKTDRILSDDEMKYGMMTSSYPCYLSNWKPGQVREVKQLWSSSISAEYVIIP